MHCIKSVHALWSDQGLTLQLLLILFDWAININVVPTQGVIIPVCFIAFGEHYCPCFSQPKVSPPPEFPSTVNPYPLAMKVRQAEVHYCEVGETGGTKARSSGARDGVRGPTSRASRV